MPGTAVHTGDDMVVQRQVYPWGLLAHQSNLLGKFQATEKTSLQKINE